MQAVLRGIAHRIDDIVQTIAKTGHVVAELRCDGGPARNPYLMQYQSDITGLNAQVAAGQDLAALGVAKMAALALGEQVGDGVAAVSGRYRPGRDEWWRERQRRRWGEAVARARQWGS